MLACEPEDVGGCEMALEGSFHVCFTGVTVGGVATGEGFALGCGCGGMTGSSIPAARATMPTPRMKSCLVRQASICAFSSVTPPASGLSTSEEARYAQNAGRPTLKSDRKHAFPGVVHDSLTLSSNALDLSCRLILEIDGGVDEGVVADVCGECDISGEGPGSRGMSRESMRMS